MFSKQYAFLNWDLVGLYSYRIQPSIFMKENKQLIWLLIIYVLLQKASLYFGSGVLMVTYMIIYAMAIISGCRIVYVFLINGETYRKIIIPFLLFFTANLLLFLFYIPTLLLNPDINWRLKGEYEVDPMILQAYFPLVFCITSFLILSIVAGITLLRKKDNRQ